MALVLRETMYEIHTKIFLNGCWDGKRAVEANVLGLTFGG